MEKNRRIQRYINSFVPIYETRISNLLKAAVQFPVKNRFKLNCSHRESGDVDDNVIDSQLPLLFRLLP